MKLIQKETCKNMFAIKKLGFADNQALTNEH